MRRLQNIVSESRLTLPFMAVYALLVWLAYGLVSGGLWVQFACFAASTWLMVELNNSFALIRIYSRMVSATYIGLTCAACFLFDSVGGAVASLCAVAAYATLFRSYQDKRSPGLAFYTFALLALSSLFRVQMLFYAPLFWLLMATSLRSLSWRTFASSLLGLCAPYWALCCYRLWDGRWPGLGSHFDSLASFGPILDFGSPTVGQWAALGLMIAAGATGVVHYYRQSNSDKLRTRMLYNCFTIAWAASVVLALLQPQHSDVALRMMAINASPLFAHFTALTQKRLTNAAFVLFALATIAVTVVNLWEAKG